MQPERGKGRKERRKMESESHFATTSTLQHVGCALSLLSSRPHGPEEIADVLALMFWELSASSSMEEKIEQLISSFPQVFFIFFFIFFFLCGYDMTSYCF